MKEIINSIKTAISVIKKNKSKVFFLFFLQIIFFIVLSLIFYNTIIPSMEHAKKAVDYYDTINITETSGMFGYLGEDPLIIYESYRNMLYYLKFMVLFAFLAFIIINSLIWAFTDNLVNKKTTKQFFSYITNFGLITLISALVFYIVIFNALRASLVKFEETSLPSVGILFLSLLLLYFTFISFALIDKRKLKDICRLTMKLGIFKFPSVLLTYLINLTILFLFSYLIFLTIELNMVILSIVIILFVLSFVLTRLFLIIAINDLVKKI